MSGGRGNAPGLASFREHVWGSFAPAPAGPSGSRGRQVLATPLSSGVAAPLSNLHPGLRAEAPAGRQVVGEGTRLRLGSELPRAGRARLTRSGPRTKGSWLAPASSERAGDVGSGAGGRTRRGRGLECKHEVRKAGGGAPRVEAVTGGLPRGRGMRRGRRGPSSASCSAF